MSRVSARINVALAAFALSATLFGAVSAQELTEKERLKKCEIDICKIITEKKKDGADFGCDLSKTWAKEDISKEAEEKKLSWGLGDAKCSVSVKVARANIVSAVTDADYTLTVPPQKVTCDVDQGGTKYPINLAIGPVVKFKGGEAIEASLGVTDIEAASAIKAVIWTAAKMEENFGIFHKDILKDINKFITKKCPKALAEAK
ncbi:MAG: hypothetical protein SGJ17_15140 [Hyphomicrobiales bacterium]|mgnify:CR=1 FL=1|nr:hypothetical protein [Hyphomicrobiales bacterium]